jgi:hypothetical protein
MEIKTYEKANIYLNDLYINEHNNKFSIQAREPKNLHEKLSNNELELFDEYFAKESIRTLKRD